MLVIQQAKRTVKLLTAITQNTPVVSEQWAKDCIERKELLERYGDYVPASSEEFVQKNGDSLEKLLRARSRLGDDFRVFRDLRFWVSEGAEPSRRELESLIRLGGGTVLEKRPNRLSNRGKNQKPVYCVLGSNSLEDFEQLRDTKSFLAESELVLSSCLTSKWDPDDFVVDEDFFNERAPN